MTEKKTDDDTEKKDNADVNKPIDDLNVAAAGHGQTPVQPMPQPVVPNDPEDGVPPKPPKDAP